MNPFVKKAAFTIEKYGMISETDNILCGFSGGADSTAMLIALNELYCGRVTAVHINHNLRGEESDGDEKFCRELCGKRSIPIAVFSVDVKKYADEKKLGTEEAARVLRYEAFRKVGERLGKYVICTAHTLSDNAETVIFNLARGTGISGLCGIPPVRENIVRPLIECTREDVEKYLMDIGQDYVTDSTNLSDDYSRNKIRHNVIPVLREINSGFYGSISSLTETCAEDRKFAEECLADALAEGKKIGEIPEYLRKIYIREMLREKDIPVSAKRISEICGLISRGGRLQLSGDIYAVYRNDKLEILEMPSPAEYDICCELKIGENDFVGDKTVTVRCVTGENLAICSNIQSKLTNNILDCDKIQGKTFLRTRKNGDKFLPAGKRHTRSLKKFLNEYRPSLSIGERNTVVCIEDSLGLIWVEKLGAAERVKADGGTVSAWEIDVYEKS